MAVLKKIKASTLMETLIASVLIVIVFMIASMILNNLFYNSIKNDSRAIDARLNELQYLCEHQKIVPPYRDSMKFWDIDITVVNENNRAYVFLTAFNTSTHKTIERKILEK